MGQALKDPKWVKAMQDEYDALIWNKTWNLVPPTLGQNLVGNKWVFCIKRNPDGSIELCKAHLVAKGFHQRPGVDFHETFSPVINPITVSTILNLVVN